MFLTGESIDICLFTLGLLAAFSKDYDIRVR